MRAHPTMATAPSSIDFEEEEPDTQPALEAEAPSQPSPKAFSGLAALRASMRPSSSPKASTAPSPSSRLRALEDLKDHELPPPVYTLPELTRIPLALSWCAALLNGCGLFLAIPAYVIPWYTVRFSSVDTARQQVTTSVLLSLTDVLYTCLCPTCWLPPPNRPLESDCFPNARLSYPRFLAFWFGTFNPDSPLPTGGVDAVMAAVAFVALGMAFSLAAGFSIVQEIAATRATLDLPPWRRLLCQLLPEPKWTGTAVASQALCATAFSCSLLGCIIGWVAMPAFSKTLTGINTLIFWGAGTLVPVEPAPGSTIAALLCTAHFLAMVCEVQRKFFLRRVAREDPGNKCAWPSCLPLHTRTPLLRAHSHTEAPNLLTPPPFRATLNADAMLKLCGGAHDEMGWCA